MLSYVVMKTTCVKSDNYNAAFGSGKEGLGKKAFPAEFVLWHKFTYYNAAFGSGKEVI
ncbi:MAG: hypothetical protein ACI4VG_00160 [Lachnospiraceae bacterium]